jgi:2-(1,2-epoxy-1,2-dihydrophenyl)acetyl-CoA isomerase
MRRFWGNLGRAFDAHAEPADVQLLADGRVLVTGTYVGVARSTGRKLEAAFTHTVAVRDGRISGLVQVTDSKAWADALAQEPHLTTLTLSVDDGIARMRLDRPDAANAIDVAMASDLRVAAEALTARSDLRALLITGSGKRFCAGGDIGVFAHKTAGELSTLLSGMIENYHVALRLIPELPVPVVCAVQGAAAGGGLGLAYASDIVLAADDAKFALGFSHIGLTLDGGNTYYLPRLVGPARAALMYLENTVVSAPEALQMGLVSEVVPAGDLTARAEALVATLAAGPTVALGLARQLLRTSWDRTLPEQLAAERQAMSDVARTADAVEGVTAYAERRPPRFTGS